MCRACSRIEKLRSAGARQYLTKPLDVRQFLETVERLLSDGSMASRRRGVSWQAGEPVAK